MELSRGETYDIGLRNYMTSIYNLMLLGLLASAGAAWLAGISGLTVALLQGGLLFWVVALSPSSDSTAAATMKNGNTVISAR